MVAPMRKRRRTARRRPWRLILTVLAVLVAAVVPYAVELFGGQGVIPTWRDLYESGGLEERPALPAQGETAVTFLDVGQGDAVLVQQNGVFCLLDAGTPDVQDTIADDLRSLGVTELELMVMTHPHSDHYGGMPGVLEEIPVQTLLLPDLSQSDTQSGNLGKTLELAREQGTELKEAEEGMSFPIGSGTLTVLCDGYTPEGGEDDDVNDLSLWLLFEAGNFTFLDTGDAEQEAEAAVTARLGSELRADLMKAGHHGSQTSNGETLLRTVCPQIVVASCGLNNSYGHPHQAVIDRMEALGIAFYRTDLDGAVTVTAGEEGLTVQTTREQTEALDPAA